MSDIYVINGAELRDVIDSNSKVIVDFYKDSCAPCSMMQLLLSKYLDEHPDCGIVVVKVKLEAVGAELFEEYGVRSTPTLIFYHDGNNRVVSPGMMTRAAFESLVNKTFV